MSPRRQVLSLAGLLLSACVVLAGLAWRSVSQESAQAELRYRQRAEAALDAAERALHEALVSQAAARGAPVTSRAPSFRSGGLGPSAAWEAMDLRAADLERLESARSAEASLLAFAAAARPERAADAAAALGAAATLAQREGRAAEARGRWEQVAELAREHTGIGDARGLAWGWLARYHLALESAARADGLLALLADVGGAHDPGFNTAQGVFRRRVLAEVRRGRLSPAQRATLARTLEEDARHSLRRRLAVYGGIAGVRSWCATGSGPRAFELPGEPTRPALVGAGRRVLVVPASGPLGPERGGHALTLADLVPLGLGSSEVKAYAELGFEVRESGAQGDVPVVARRELAGLFAGLKLEVAGSERDAFVAAERRRLHQTLGLVGGALLLIVLGCAFVLRSLLREAETARAQRNFVAAVTHELKTPLASIRLLGELLAEGGVEAAQAKDFAQRVVGETDRLTGLVSAVLELSRAERGIDPNSRTRVAPREVAEDAMERVRLPAEEAGATLELHVEEGLPPLLGDREGLVGVLVNLLDNSLKYADLTQPVELALDARGGVRFRVLDRGPGVPGPERERIFEPFWRCQDEMTRERPGVGLGLALGRSVAEAHGGELRYEVREGGGSEFVLLLPAEEGA